MFFLRFQNVTYWMQKGEEFEKITYNYATYNQHKFCIWCE